MSDATLRLLLLLWVPVFVALWLFVGGRLAERSQWTALAERFSRDIPPDGKVLRGQVVGVGPVDEKNVTKLIAARAGLYLSSNMLFRFRRPPLLIPWNELKYESTDRRLWLRYHTFSLASGVTTIRVRDKALRAFGAFLPDVDVEALLK